MDIFKEASRKGLRVKTSKGLLTVEQLWTLPISELDTLAVSLQEIYEESGKKKSYLTKKSVKDKEAKLAFDIVLEILTTLAGEADDAKEAKEIKEHNAKILGLIAEKDEETLKGKSKKQLLEMLK